MEQRNKILIVDDMEINRAILCESFKDEYQSLEAENGLEALELARQYHNDIAVILLDIVMPVMDGFQLMENLQIEGILSKVPVILITADAYNKNEIRGLELGASDIILKPFDPHIVKKRVQNIADLYRHKNNLENMVQMQTKKLQETNSLFVDSLSTIIENRNMESGQHIRHIRGFTRVLLEAMTKAAPEYELTPEKIETIVSAAAMHDVGKIAIPDSILLKPGRLTTDEFDIMKTHTVRGCEIIKSFKRMEDKDYLRYCYNICRYHHERWDGRGYPDGLERDEIPVCAQVVAVADVYDALTTDRVYKPAILHEEAVRMILGGECGKFSDLVLRCFQQVGYQFRKISEAHRDGNDAEDELDLDELSSELMIEKPLTMAGLTIHSKFQQASAALQKETLERDTLINAIPGGVAKVSIDEDFHILLASDGFYRLTGYNRMEYHSPPIEGCGIALIIPEDVPAIVENLNRQISQNVPLFVEYRIRKKDGSIAWINVHGSTVENEYGKPVVQAVFIDVTETKRTEQKLVGLINSVPGGIAEICIDRALSVKYASDGFYQITGRTKMEYDGIYGRDNLIQIIHPEDREMVLRKIVEVKETKERTVAMECRVPHKDGTVVWVMVNGVRMEDESGAISYQCIFSDITETKNAQERLFLNEERYRLIVEQAKDVIYEWNVLNDTVYYSPAFVRKFGYEVPKEHFLEEMMQGDIICEDDKESFYEHMERLKNGAPYDEREYRIKTLDGNYVWCKASASVIFDHRHIPVSVVGIISDVTGYKKEREFLEAQAQQDLLTGLYNKITSQTMIADFLAGPGRERRHALFILDIDNFKDINDTFGHPKGDQVLQEVAKYTRQRFRDKDIVGRAGGDEFIVLMKDVEVGGAEKKASMLREMFRAQPSLTEAGFRVSVSIGVSLYPQDGSTFEELFQNADNALYDSKEQGKDRYTFAK